MDALETAYRRFGLQIYRRCMRLLRDEAEAEDAAHEVFLRAFGRLPPSEEEAMAWLYRVSTNYCLNRLRNRGMRERSDWKDGLRALAERAASSPEGSAAERELALLCLDGHDEETQAIAIYYYVDGMSQGEIAALVGLSRATINRKLRDFAEQASATARGSLS
jgi:RNA polymerase sigma-70 factor (ECF subfamily)